MRLTGRKLTVRVKGTPDEVFQVKVILRVAEDANRLGMPFAQALRLSLESTLDKSKE